MTFGLNDISNLGEFQNYVCNMSSAARIFHLQNKARS